MSNSNTSQEDEKPLLTFNALYNILRTEKKNHTLQKFPSKFYEALEELIEQKNEEIKKLKKENETEKLKKEQQVKKNIKKISDELIALRTQKIAKIATQNTIFGDNILEEDHILEKEKNMYEALSKNIKQLRK